MKKSLNKYNKYIKYPEVKYKLQTIITRKTKTIKSTIKSSIPASSKVAIVEATAISTLTPLKQFNYTLKTNYQQQQQQQYNYLTRTVATAIHREILLTGLYRTPAAAATSKLSSTSSINDTNYIWSAFNKIILFSTRITGDDGSNTVGIHSCNYNNNIHNNNCSLPSGNVICHKFSKLNSLKRRV